MARSKTTKKARVPARVEVTGEAKRALAEIEGELARLRADELLPVNVDIARSVSIVLGVEAQIGAYTEEIARALPDHDRASIARLRTYALAALYAHLEAQPAPPSTTLSDLLVEAVPLKQTLVVAADGLAHAGLVDGERLAEIKSGSGHVDLAADLVALAALFDVAWAGLEGKTFIARADVERAAHVGTELLVALGAKNHLVARSTPEAIARKQRAFTLLVRAYDEARRALSYLRWHADDVDLIAPSLYKRTRRRASVVEEVDEVEAEQTEAEDEGEEVVPAPTTASTESAARDAAAV